MAHTIHFSTPSYRYYNYHSFIYCVLDSALTYTRIYIYMYTKIARHALWWRYIKLNNNWQSSIEQTMLIYRKFVHFLTCSPILLTADNVKNDMHIKMFIKKDRTRERIEIECIFEKMTTMSNTHSQCSATYQPNLHSMRTLVGRQ